jgi:hypothetical protein
MCLTVGGEEEGWCGISVIHGGIPYCVACALGWGAHGGSQYPWPEGGEGVLELWPGCPAHSDGGQYLVGGSGGHVKIYPAMGDPLHGITGVGPI